MIARIWHGRTKVKDSEAYTLLMNKIAIPDYEKTEGFKKLSFLKRIEGDEAHFTLITYWESLEIIEKFAGKDLDKAKYYPEDKQFLLEFEDKVVHHEVFAER